jgi:aspartate beta-hydroxylase
LKRKGTTPSCYIIEFIYVLKLLENNWLTIRNEAIAQINQKTRTFLPEDETLLNKGDWKQFNLYLRGKKVVENCQKMPFTCYLIDQIVPAHSCSRCQIKFSLMSQVYKYLMAQFYI